MVKAINAIPAAILSIPSGLYQIDLGTVAFLKDVDPVLVDHGEGIAFKDNGVFFPIAYICENSAYIHA